MKTMFLRGAMISLAVLGTTFGVAAAPASAVIRDTDYGREGSGPADFGTGGHTNGWPEGNGRITWDVTPTTTTATLSGRVYWDNVFSGGCARVLFTLVKTNNTTTSVASPHVCQVGSRNPFDALPSKAISVTRSSAIPHRVIVMTQRAATPTSGWVNDGSFSRYFMTVDGRD